MKLFSYLKERLSKKTSGWHARTISQGGKEVLIKAVASALPVLPMSVYRLPKTVIASLHSVMSNFWWDNAEHKRKIHWLSWEKLSLSKEEGGMGFKDLECLNQALLAKQAWRIIHCDDCLMTKILKGKYLGEESFVQVQQCKNASYAWKSILYGRELLIKGLKRSVGNGRDIRVWTEPWLEDDEGVCRPPLRKQRCFDVNLLVSELIDYRRRRWNRRRLEEIFVPDDVRTLVKNQPAVSEQDSWVWKHNRSGVYSVKTGYELAMSENKKIMATGQSAFPSLNPVKARVWECQVPPKIKIFMWKALSGALSVFDALQSRGMRCAQPAKRVAMRVSP